MGALKGFVVAMGLLIVVGMGLLAWGLYHKATNPDFKLFAGPAAPASFGEVALPAPAGCAIAEARLEAERLVVRLAGSDRLASRLGLEAAPDCERVFLVDAATGAVAGVVRLGKAP